jgi:hypothetical protein
VLTWCARRAATSAEFPLHGSAHHNHTFKAIDVSMTCSAALDSTIKALVG